MLVRLLVQVLAADRAEAGAVGVVEDLGRQVERRARRAPSRRGRACRPWTYGERSSSSASALDAWYSRAERSWSIAVSRRQRWHGPCRRPDERELEDGAGGSSCGAKLRGNLAPGRGGSAVRRTRAARAAPRPRPETARPTGASTPEGRSWSCGQRSSVLLDLWLGRLRSGPGRLRPDDQHDGRRRSRRRRAAPRPVITSFRKTAPSSTAITGLTYAYVLTSSVGATVSSQT